MSDLAMIESRLSELVVKGSLVVYLLRQLVDEVRQGNASSTRTPGRNARPSTRKQRRGMRKC